MRERGDPSFARRGSASALVVAWPWPWAGGAMLALLSGCGGGLPLLHPAQTLPQGEVTAEAGFSAG